MLFEVQLEVKHLANATPNVTCEVFQVSVIEAIQQVIHLNACTDAVSIMQLLSKVLAFPFMQLRRKYHFVGHFLMFIVTYSPFSLCQGENACTPCDGISVPCKCITVLAGSPAEFRCTGQYLETSLWRVQRPGGNFYAIAQSGVVYSYNKEKFDLYINDSSANNSSSSLQILTLNETTVEDDGMYRCEEEGQIKTLTSLTVEAVPHVQLKNNNTVITTKIDVVLNQEVRIKCVAEGGKPQVTLAWMVNGEEKSGRFIDNPPPTSQRVTSTIHLLPTIEDETLTCVASGQEVIPQTSVSVDLNVQYSPNCVMGITNGLDGYDIKCSCNANPEVKKYRIYKDNLLFSNESETTLQTVEISATVFCNATNDVGSFATHPQKVEPIHGKSVPVHSSKTGLIVGGMLFGVSIVGILVAVIWCLNKRARDAEDRAEEYKARAEKLAQTLKEQRYGRIHRFRIRMQSFILASRLVMEKSSEQEDDEHETGNH